MTGLYNGAAGLSGSSGLWGNVAGLWSGATGLQDGSGGPTLSLNFLSGVLDSRVAFARLSTATFVGSNGLIQTAATNTPRFDYNPNGNLIRYSEQFDNAAWSKSDVTVTANTTTSPDGTADADSYVEGTAGTASIGQSFTGTANATFTATIYVKRVNTDWVRVTLQETAASTNRNTGWFNLSTGAVGSFTNGGTGSGATGSVSDAGNGWYRLRLTGAVNNSATALSFYVSSASANNSGARVNNAEYQLWGAQLQEGSTATAYIPTTATAPVRTIKGLLLESQSTNLLTYSEQFDNAAWSKTATVTANTLTSPNGTTNADLVSTVANFDYVRQVITATANAQYTTTFFVKPVSGSTTIRILLTNATQTEYAGSNFGLTGDGSLGTAFTTGTGVLVSRSITNVGNGWYRCSVTATNNTTSLYALIDNHAGGVMSFGVWGAQLEAFNFASSYIPTVASQVTRGRDDAVMEGSNLTSWCDPNEGTMVSEHVARLGVDQQPFAIDILPTYLLRTRQNTGNIYVFVVRDPTNRDLNSTPVPALTEGQIVKIAAAYATNALALSGGGQAVSTGSVFAPFTPTRASIGTAAASTAIHIRSVTYYNRRLTNAQLQALSTP